MKKLLALLLVVVLTATMFACGGTAEETTAPTDSTETTATTTTSGTTATTPETTETTATTATTATTEPPQTTETTTSTPTPITPSTDEYAKNLAAYWNFEENQDGVLVDLSGNGNDGTIAGTPEIVEGKDGNAFSFTALGQHIEVKKSDSLAFSADKSFSLVATFQWDGRALDNWPCIINNGLMTTTKNFKYFGFWINHTNKIPQFGISNANATGTLNIAPQNYTLDTEWHTFVMVQDGEAGTLKFYIDGILVGTTDAINAMTEANLFIAYNGNSGNQGQFTGIIDDIRIYDCAISETYIQSISE